MRERNDFETIVKWVIIAVLAIVAVKVALTVLGMAFSLAAFLLFTVAPLVVVGWLVWSMARCLLRDRSPDASADL